MIEPDELIDLYQAAQLAHCSKETLARAYRDKKLHCVRPGRKLQTTWDWVQAYLEQKDQPIAPASKYAYTKSKTARVWITLTGEMEAIPLEYLRPRDLWYLNQEISDLIQGPHPNGGFARFVLELKRGVVDLIEMVKTSKPENRR